MDILWIKTKGARFYVSFNTEQWQLRWVVDNYRQPVKQGLKDNASYSILLEILIEWQKNEHRRAYPSPYVLCLQRLFNLLTAEIYFS